MARGFPPRDPAQHRSATNPYATCRNAPFAPPERPGDWVQISQEARVYLGGPRNNTITLPGGRRLGYAKYGDPDAMPVLYCHGFPSCRLEPSMLPVSGIRLIALDRPGYGLSEPLPGRTLRDWPRDVAAAADALGLHRFAVVGVSGGAPYAA